MTRYYNRGNKTVDNFLGIPDWRPAWKDAEARGEPFWGFITNVFSKQMEKLDYLDQAAEQAELVRSTEKNLPLYRLAFFSRHKLGERFWRDVKKYANPQTSFDFQ